MELETIDINKKEELLFISEPIPNDILNKMIGKSIPEKDVENINIEELSYLKITYWGFDEKIHIGDMIVNKKIAQEVLDIFKEIYSKKYPIEKIRLIDEYDGNDEKSMQDNNTSSFCYRVISGTNKLSMHSLGLAIDINPLYNPCVEGEKIEPKTATKFINRELDIKGIIRNGDDLYNAFIKRDWMWGGDWKIKKDYQHFYKLLGQ